MEYTNEESVLYDFVRDMLRFCCRFIEALSPIYEKIAKTLWKICQKFMEYLSLFCQKGSRIFHWGLIVFYQEFCYTYFR